MTRIPPARPARAGTSRHGGGLAGLTEAQGESAELPLIGASVNREPADRNAARAQQPHRWNTDAAGCESMSLHGLFENGPWVPGAIRPLMGVARSPGGAAGLNYGCWRGR